MKKYQTTCPRGNLSISILRVQYEFEVTFKSNNDSFWEALSRFKRIIPDPFRRRDFIRRLWVVSYYAEDELREWVEEMQMELSAEVSPTSTWRQQPQPQPKQKIILCMIPP
jgi:hypothetical protein